MSALARQPVPRHAVAIGTAQGIASGGAPALLQIDGADFIPTLLDALRSAGGRSALRGKLAQTRVGGVLKLFQPVQRRFHVALIDLWCPQPGTPRLDPKRVDSAGLVLRRLRADGSLEGWMRAGPALRGWVPVDTLGDELADPEPARRLARLATGATDIDRALAPIFAARAEALFTEDFSPLHPAPPEVCAAAGRTTYYGLVSTVSAEQTPEDPVQALAGFGASDDAFAQHLMAPLRGEEVYFPLAGKILNAQWLRAITAAGDSDPVTVDPTIAVEAAVWSALQNAASRHDLQRFVQLLRQLAGEFDAFGTSAASRALYAELDGLRLPLPLKPGQVTPDTVSAAVFVRDAATLLLTPQAGTPQVEMPLRWPALDAAPRLRLRQTLAAALVQRFGDLQLMQGRYDLPDARYRLRAFVRLKADGPCPPRTVWSEYSEAFTIARWYESAGAAPARIELPGLDGLKGLKPNVAFAVPPALQGLLNGSAKDLASGKGKAGPELGLGWICSFSLPSITICAFICLNLFLSLFDLIFGWLAFIKICIPYPKPK
ncbi:MAG: hypothetical protein NVS9B10_15530 [Nevskia sp.]